MNRAASFIKALRPLQWVKNFLVFFPLVFAVRVAWSPSDLTTLPQLLFDLVVVFLAFCAVSSAIYLVNDLADRNADRNHPVKCNRPIASGAVGMPAAVLGIIVLAGAGLAALAWVDLAALWITLAYLAINLAYSLGAKNLALLDLLAVAGGYVIRVAIGAAAIDVAASPWLYATTAARSPVHRGGTPLRRSKAGRRGFPNAAPSACQLFRAVHRPVANNFGNRGLVKLYSLHGGSAQPAGQSRPCC